MGKILLTSVLSMLPLLFAPLAGANTTEVDQADAKAQEQSTELTSDSLPTDVQEDLSEMIPEPPTKNIKMSTCDMPIHKGLCLLKEFDLDDYALLTSHKQAEEFLSNVTLYTDKSARKALEKEPDQSSVGFEELSYLIENHQKLQTLSSAMLADSLGTITGIGLLEKVLSGGRETRKGMFRTIVFAYPEHQLKDLELDIVQAGIEDFKSYLSSLNIVDTIEFSDTLPGGLFNKPNSGFVLTGKICELALKEPVSNCYVTNRFFSGEQDISKTVIDGVPTAFSEVRYFRFSFMDHRAMNASNVDSYFYVGMMYGLTSKMAGNAYLYEPKTKFGEVGYLYNGTDFYPIAKKP